jgi:hypothetical protein
MDFLCPSCQKMLTVPDQYAGTLMKCPLCQQTFQAPALAAPPAPLAAAPATAAPATGGADVYGLKEPLPAAPPPAASPLPPLGAVTASTGSAPPALGKVPPSKPPLPPSTDYRGGFTIPFSPDVLPWIAPVCLGLIFLSTLFFPWVGYYWNGTGMLTQGLWRGLIGRPASPDMTLWQTVSGLDLNKAPAGVNWLLWLYLPLFLLALGLAVVSALLPRAQVKLPPAVDQVKQYRWGLVAVLALLGFLILSLFLVLNFSMQNGAWEAAKAKVAAVDKSSTGDAADNAPKSDAERDLRVGKEYEALGVRRTRAFQVVLLLQLVAAIGAGLAFWLDYRGAGQPIPQLAMRW